MYRVSGDANEAFVQSVSARGLFPETAKAGISMTFTEADLFIA